MLLVVLVYSCTSKKGITSGEIDPKLSAKAIIKNHYRNATDFNTISGKLKIVYQDGKNEQSLVVSLRMKKDETIWMSAPFGVVKALITPERVSFYNKLENEYFDGDFGYLSSLLGTEIDYRILQNLLLGESLVDLGEDRYVASPMPNYYEIKPRKSAALFKTLFWIDPGSFKMQMQQISQPEDGRLLQIYYKTYEQNGKKLVPHEIDIIAKNSKDSTNITLEYRNIEIDRPLNFPYKIPKGYQEIVLK